MPAWGEGSSRSGSATDPPALQCTPRYLSGVPSPESRGVGRRNEQPGPSLSFPSCLPGRYQSVKPPPWKGRPGHHCAPSGRAPPPGPPTFQNRCPPAQVALLRQPRTPALRNRFHAGFFPSQSLKRSTRRRVGSRNLLTRAAARPVLGWNRKTRGRCAYSPAPPHLHRPRQGGRRPHGLLPQGLQPAGPSWDPTPSRTPRRSPGAGLTLGLGPGSPPGLGFQSKHRCFSCSSAWWGWGQGWACSLPASMPHKGPPHLHPFARCPVRISAPVKIPSHVRGTNGELDEGPGGAETNTRTPAGSGRRETSRCCEEAHIRGCGEQKRSNHVLGVAPDALSAGKMGHQPIGVLVHTRDV